MRSINGASNYVLTIGRSGGAALGLGANTNFIPGELVVETTTNPNARAATLATLAGVGMHSADAGGARASGNSSGPTLMRFDPAKTLTAMGVDTARALSANMSAEARSRQGTLLAAKMLRQQAGVRSADPNYLRQPSAIPNDPLYRLQWHFRDISLPQAWDLTTGSANVTIAVIDTGVRTDHPDLVGQLTGNGFDFIADATRARDGDGIDANPLDPGDQGVGGTSSFHGTHVTGTIVAATNNGVGVSGICWNCKVMPLRVLGVGGGTSFDLIAAIRYAARLTNSSGQLPIARADIINMSLGGGGFSQTEQNTITEARNAGVIIIAAAGNESSAAPSYPASYAGVVSVSATTITRTRASYSNFGANIDVAAPGGNNERVY